MKTRTHHYRHYRTGNTPALFQALAAACALLLYGAGVCDAGEELFVVTTDYETGGHAVMTPGAADARTRIGTIFQDSVARSFGATLYVLERLGGDNVIVFDQANLESPLRQFSLGSGANPHDIVHISATKAYVTCYESGTLLIVDPARGRLTGEIDLTAFADSDGIPEMDRMVLRGGQVFVSLQRLDRAALFQPAGAGRIAVIDTARDACVDVDPQRPGTQAIELALSNPVDMQYLPEEDLIVVAGAGSLYNATDGGIEIIDPATLQTRGTVMTETEIGGQLGGAFGALALQNSSDGYAVVMTPDWQESRVVHLNLADRSSAVVHAPRTGFVHADVLLTDGRLYVCDRTPTGPGIRVFDTATDQEIASTPVATGLPPFCLALVGAEDSGSGADPPGPDNGTAPLSGTCYVTALLSSAPLPFFIDVCVFGDDGAFALQKLAPTGNGSYYHLSERMFYFVCNSTADTAVQFIQGTGLFLGGPARPGLITGAGSIMIKDTLQPFLFCGAEYPCR